jgi:hypothetical protein
MASANEDLTRYGIEYFVPRTEGEDSKALLERARRLGAEHIEHLAVQVFAASYRDWILVLSLFEPWQLPSPTKEDAEQRNTIYASLMPKDRGLFVDELVNDLEGLRNHQISLGPLPGRAYWLVTCSGEDDFNGYEFSVLTVGSTDEDEDEDEEADDYGS